MSDSIVFDANSIRQAMHKVRQEEGRRDDDWVTATGTDLDAIGAFYDLTRSCYEADNTLRARIEAAINKRMSAR